MIAIDNCSYEVVPALLYTLPKPPGVAAFPGHAIVA